MGYKTSSHTPLHNKTILHVIRVATTLLLADHFEYLGRLCLLLVHQNRELHQMHADMQTC